MIERDRENYSVQTVTALCLCSYFLRLIPAKNQKIKLFIVTLSSLCLTNDSSLKFCCWKVKDLEILMGL